MKEELSAYLKRLSGVPGLSLEFTENADFGDFSTNIAFSLAKEARRSPLEIAEKLAKKIGGADGGKYFSKVEAAAPGFVNLKLSNRAAREYLKEILKKKEKFGRERPGSKKEKIQMEFISANPTGPLTMANGRGGFLGDALSNALEAYGYKVTREYYVNDAGNQVRNLGGSVLAELGLLPWAENYYKGSYIKEIARELDKKMGLKKKKAGETLREKVGSLAAQKLLVSIKKSVKDAGVKIDVWTSESRDIRKKKLVEKTLETLRAKDLISEHDGAVWLKKEIAGEKERVLRKSDGEYTYYMVDLAYHFDSFKNRKFDEVINLWGTDHHANVAPMKEGLKLLGMDADKLQVILFQLVRLIRGGEEVKMSKRAGEFITLDDLLEEVGKDAARFFFLMVSPSTHMDFDLDLAKERSMKNPVYYVQYAYVRTLGILEKIKGAKNKNPKLELLSSDEDRELIIELAKFPDYIKQTARDRQVIRFTRYATELARRFHNFYEKERIIGEKPEVALARLELVRASKIVFENLFGILGISKPKKM